MAHPMFEMRFPRSTALGLEPVSDGTAEHAAFDSDEVLAKLGEDRFNQLMSGVKAVLSCGHRSHPSDHADKSRAGAEVHCIFANDLEKFLREQPLASK